MKNDIRRGDIWIVDLDPTLGHEIRKLRPSIVIQNDYGNRYSALTIVAPITSQKREKFYPFEVFIESRFGLKKDSKVMLNHIRSVDKIRLVKKLGKIDEELQEKIDDAIRVSLGVVHL